MLIAILLSVPTAFAALCYQCASELALINWSRYGLPHAYGDSMMADDSCLDEERLTGHIPCNTPCMTVNITAIGGKHDGKVLGIVRDCQRYFRNPKTLPEGSTQVCRSSERITLRNQKINVTFCYCQGTLCNGKALAHFRRSSLRNHLVRSDPSFASPCSSTLMTVLLWLYFRW